MRHGPKDRLAGKLVGLEQIVYCFLRKYIKYLGTFSRDQSGVQRVNVLHYIVCRLVGHSRGGREPILYCRLTVNWLSVVSNSP